MKERIVVKIGSGLIVQENKTVDLNSLQNICNQLCHLMRQGHEVVLVSSGAVALGMGIKRIEKRTGDESQKRALAAIGQTRLISHYTNILACKGITAAQDLVADQNFSDQESRECFRSKIENTFVDRNTLWIINENDSAVNKHHRIGDNDTLSAMVAQAINADRLIILSGIHGFYRDKNDETTIIYEINSLEEILHLAHDTDDESRSVGGMKTKLSAARICLENNIQMNIAHGRTSDILARAVQHEERLCTRIAGRERQQRILSF